MIMSFIQMTLILRRVKNALALNIFIEDYEKLHAPKLVTLHCSPEETVQQVMERIIVMESLILREEDSLALYMPTKKSKKGVLMERGKILSSFGLPDKVLTILHLFRSKKIHRDFT
jgi:hypothetical protein